ncbi:MAG: hypothetical protein WD646_08335 [Actinomycetota bacterium]
MKNHAAVATAGVAAVALLALAVIVVAAPWAAKRPPTDGSALDLSATDASPFPAPRFRTGLNTASPSSGPSDPLLTTPRSEEAPVLEPTTAPTASPAHLVADMRVSSTEVATGSTLVYQVVVTNDGGRSYKGAFTVNQHTPAGTLMCTDLAGLDACIAPGDHDGTSKDPDAPHLNPTGTTKVASVNPNQTIVLTTLRVLVVTPVEGSVLRNHAHVEGVGVGESSSTVIPKDSHVTGLSLGSGIEAPTVRVTR